MIGKLLVARPSLLGDPSFGRGVVLMAENSTSGAIGFLVNQPTEYSTKDLIPEFQIDAPIFQGGPVDQDRLFFVHTSSAISNTKKIGNQLFWGGDLYEIEAALSSGDLTQDGIKFFVGYAGWDEAQLKRECDEDSWLLVKNNYDIFGDTTDLWRQILNDIGGQLALYAAAPSHPGLN